VAPQRRARSVKAAAQGLAYFLKDARVLIGSLSRRVPEEAVRQIDPDRVVRYTGKALQVLDPTEDEKRSRGQGTCGRQMEYIGRMRRSKATRPPRAPRTARSAWRPRHTNAAELI